MPLYLTQQQTGKRETLRTIKFIGGLSNCWWWSINWAWGLLK